MVEPEVARRRWMGGLSWNKAALPAAILFWSLCFGSINPNFCISSNLTNMARQTSILAIASVVQTMVILTGGVHLSQGSVLGLMCVVAATRIVSRGIAFGIVVALALGLAIGMVQGSLVAYLKLPAFIVTMGGLSFLRGAAFTYTNGMPVTGLPDSFAWLGVWSGVRVPYMDRGRQIPLRDRRQRGSHICFRDQRGQIQDSRLLFQRSRWHQL
ncbi:MAG: ABC transporter permease [Bacillota bacterium]